MSTTLHTSVSPATETLARRRLTEIVVSTIGAARAVAAQIGRGMEYEYAAECMSQHQKLQQLERR